MLKLLTAIADCEDLGLYVFAAFIPGIFALAVFVDWCQC